MGAVVVPLVVTMGLALLSVMWLLVGQVRGDLGAVKADLKEEIRAVEARSEKRDVEMEGRLAEEIRELRVLPAKKGG